MEEAPENGKESSLSAHANGMNECLELTASSKGDHGSTVVQRAVLQIGRSLVRSQLVSVDFFIEIKSFQSHYGPGVNSASNRNEYQEYFLGVQAVGA